MVDITENVRKDVLECIKKKDKEINELRAKLEQHDRIISVLICDTRQLRCLMGQDKIGAREYSSIAASNNSSKLEVSINELCDSKNMYEEIQKMKTCLESNEKQVEQVKKECADYHKTVNNMKRKLDDEYQKNDEFSKELKEIKLNTEEHNIKIRNINKEIIDHQKEGSEYKNIVKAQRNELDNTNKKMEEVIKQVGGINKSIQGLNNKYEITNKNANEIKNEVGKYSTLLKEEQEKLNDHIKITNSIRAIILPYGQKLTELEKIMKTKDSEIKFIKSEIALLNLWANLQGKPIAGLQSEITNANKDTNWVKCVDLLKSNMPGESKAHKQVNNIELDEGLPIVAAREGYIELLQILLYNGLDVNVTIPKLGSSMLHRAAVCGHSNVVKFLLSRGADIKMRDSRGRTPLHLAAYSGHIHIVKLLLKRNSPINAQNEYGDTPLHCAAKWRHASVVECLLNNQCDKLIKNKEGKTALVMAKEECYSDIVKMLDK